jgi:hypothetical protein
MGQKSKGSKEGNTSIFHTHSCLIVLCLPYSLALFLIYQEFLQSLPTQTQINAVYIAALLM